jgi:copper transport protein
VLIRAQPGQDVVVQRSPDRVVLEFDESVDASLGSLRVLDRAGERVDDDQVTQPTESEVSVGIESDLSPGTYAVAWRVVSADSDPISGAYVFHVQTRSGTSASIADLVGTPPAVDIVFTAARFFDLALLLLVVGGSATLVGALSSAGSRLQRRLFRVLAAWAGALSVVGLANIELQGVAAGGLALSDAISWRLFRAVLETNYGEVLLLQSVLAATLALAALALAHAEDRDRRLLTPLMLVLAAGLSLTPSFSGHARTVGGLGLASDIFHVISAALWTGGLAFLVLALLHAGAGRWPLATRAVPRFSNMAVGSVVALLVAGTVSAYLELRTWSSLWDTRYGVLVLAKIILVTPLVALGAYNNRYAVPRLKAGIVSVLERRRFLRVVAAELTIMVAIVAITSVLINTKPPRAELAGAAASGHLEGALATGSGSFAGSVELGDLRATVVVVPAAPGGNEIHLTVLPRKDAREVTQLTVSASLPSEQLAGLTYTAEPHPSVPGAFIVANASLPIPGDWELRVEALVGRSTLLTGNITVPIQAG